jgi:succinoglycan biosynthesis transport protein ExoP
LFDGAPLGLREVPERFSRLRILVFSCTFILACAVSLGYVYTRPAEYRAVARLQISPAESVAESNDAKSSPGLQNDPKSFLTEVQVLTSRPLLEEVVKRIKMEGKLPDLGQDPIDAAQRMLHAVPVEGTQIVQLSGEGPQQSLVSLLVNTVAEVYREQLADTYKNQAASTEANVSDEAQSLRNQVLAKQRAVDQFRERYDIVSLDRKENDVLAKIEGLNRSYAQSNEQLAKARGNLQALRNAVAAGKPIARAKDDAALSALELRISGLQERMRTLQRQFSPAYLALDVETRSLPTQIAELEQQLKDKRATSAQAAIADAEDEMSGAQIAVNQLRKDLNDNQQGAKDFAAHLSEFKVMQDDLDHLLSIERAVLDRSAKLQSSVRERAPHVELLEAAAPSLAPWRPDYKRNTVISVAGSVFFGLLATWLADFLRGPAPARAMQVQHSLAMPAMARYAAPALRSSSPQYLGPAQPEQGQLPAPALPFRELEDTEVAALIANASGDLHFAIVALLTGLSAQEIAALRWEQIDCESGMVHVGGESARAVRLQAPLAAALNQRRDSSELEGPILHNERGDPLSVEDLDRLVLYGAYDAGLDGPQEITAATLRHNYLAFLLRQGIRAADISRIAGHILQAEMVAHMQSAPPRARLPLEQIDCIHPTLRDFGNLPNA